MEEFMKIDLHSFGDASAKGVAARVYVTVQQPSGTNQGLVAARSRLTRHGLTIPRLELVASHMAVNLLESASDTLDALPLGDAHCWLELCALSRKPGRRGKSWKPHTGIWCVVAWSRVAYNARNLANRCSERTFRNGPCRSLTCTQRFECCSQRRGWYSASVQPFPVAEAIRICSCTQKCTYKSLRGWRIPRLRQLVRKVHTKCH